MKFVGPNKTLNSILNEGYEHLTNFSDVKIYGKEDYRILYDPKHDEIIAKYNINKEKEIRPKG